ncbi:MAG: hypothetical protein V7641_1496 [Blastocatellia bacterium]
MKRKQTFIAWRFALLFWLACAAVGGQVTVTAQEEGPRFNLARSAAAADQFDLMISDGDERVISGTFSKAQMEVFRQVLIEARKFALTEEDVGKGTAKTTRIASSSQPALIVDVAKLDDQSQLFITFTSQIGRITIQAGRVQRGIRREYGLFFQLLSRLESLLPQTPARKT